MSLSVPELIPVWRRPIPRNRKTAAIIVIAIEALIIFALLGLAVAPDTPRKASRDLVAFDMAAEKAETEKSRNRPTPEKNTAAPPVRAPQVPLPPPPIPTPNMVVVSHDDFAAADIGKLPKGSGSSGSKAAYGPGEGPGGKTLYPAEWYVEPPRAALAPYLPEGAPPGSWAMIACRTIARYHVDNCFTLGQSQPGLSSALRQASWQFLVLPPRVDGRPLVGAWVRIRFDFTDSKTDRDKRAPDPSGE